MANTNTAAANTTWKGDAAVYTGKTQLLHGGLFYELLLLEGHLEGQTKLTLHAPKAPKAKPERVALECLECGKKFKVSPNASDPSCPKCGGVDWDVR